MPKPHWNAGLNQIGPKPTHAEIKTLPPHPKRHSPYTIWEAAKQSAHCRKAPITLPTYNFSDPDGEGEYQ